MTPTDIALLKSHDELRALVVELIRERDGLREERDAAVREAEHQSSVANGWMLACDKADARAADLEARWDADPVKAAFRARDEAITEGRRAVARAEKAERSLETAVLDAIDLEHSVERNTADRIASWLLSDELANETGVNLTDPSCPIGSALTIAAQSVKRGAYRQSPPPAQPPTAEGQNNTARGAELTLDLDATLDNIVGELDMACASQTSMSIDRIVARTRTIAIVLAATRRRLRAIEGKQGGTE